MLFDFKSQKDAEREHLHSFRQLCGDEFPSGELVEGETPDFVVIADSGRRVGIEHTQVFKQDGTDETAEQIDEATKNFIRNEALRRAEAMHLPAAHVTLFFNPQYLRVTVGNKRRALNKKERETIAERLARFVQQRMPGPGESAHIHYRLNTGQPRQTDEIIISRVHERERPYWHWMEMNSIQYDGIDRLQSAIARKSKVYAACREKCDECWLLIVAHSFVSSGTIHPDESTLNYLYESPFDRTYFLDFGYGRIARLDTIKSGAVGEDEQ